MCGGDLVGTITVSIMEADGLSSLSRDLKRSSNIPVTTGSPENSNRSNEMRPYGTNDMAIATTSVNVNKKNTMSDRESTKNTLRKNRRTDHAPYNPSVLIMMATTT
mmetsp:Transcript_25009/g.29071  ORF Transcript_25009/g.29071 Transcript_25009/m.29071 type:complete len:106 (-) Transcript_25009:17-334(-)